MPFADEARPLEVVLYRPSWPQEFEGLARRLQAALGDLATGIDHVGSTSVPGLPAKDVIDIQVRVKVLDSSTLTDRFAQIGFRQRPEPWNAAEMSFGERCEKLVFAPPVGERPANVHVRIDGAPNARYALLFRDLLRGDERLRSAWGEFKKRLAASGPDLAQYGQIKAAATDALMEAASAHVR